MHVQNKIKPGVHKPVLPAAHLSWNGNERNRRLLLLVGAAILLVLVLIADGESLSWSSIADSERLSLTVWYTVSILIALLFFGVGAIVWLYGRQRRVAVLLFGFCYMMTLVFGTLIGVNSGDKLLNAVTNSCCALAVPFLTTLLLSFPNDIFARSAAHGKLYRFLQCYLILNVLLSLFSVICSVDTYALRHVQPAWTTLLAVVYYGVSIVGIVLIVFYSSRRITSIRTQQQFRLLLNGILLSLAPIFVLTLLPMLLHLPFVVNGEQSMLFLICFPLTFGYAILRYQILILDTYIRRYIDWMTTTILLSIVIYIVITSCDFIFGSSSALFIIAVTLFLPLPALWVVSQSRKWTERFFFSEMVHYRRVVEALPLKENDFHLVQVTQALSAAACNTFAAPAACVFVLDKAQQRYSLFPPLSEQEIREQEHNLLCALASTLPVMRSSTTFAIDAQLPMLAALQTSSRPLSLQELLSSDGQEASGIARYIVIDEAPSKGRNLLFVPLRVRETMVAMLLLDERGNHEPYAGPDFEGISLLLTRFLPLFETAWLIQELQMTNEQFQSANERLSELDMLKNQFITSTSHELRTPLTAVAGYIDLLLEHADSLPHAQCNEFLRKAAVACEELVQQVKVISDAGRLQFELRRVTPSPCSLNEILAQAIEIMGVEALHQQRSILLDLSAPITVFASAHHVREVLLNLLSNAFKYSPPGTPVLIRVMPRKGDVVISVHDGGLGVPPEAQGNLFEQFVRLERDMNSPVRGAGLGLAICKQLVEAMGGRIWVSSSGIAGEGSTFSFTLLYPP